MPWFGLFLTSSALALQAWTAASPGVFPELQRHLALDWASLERFEVYRFVSSPFLQTSPGFSRTIVGLTAVVVPLWEVRTGLRRVCLTFFAGDWLSTVTILLVLKAAAAFGSGAAGALLASPDSGSSAGGFACLGALTMSMRGWSRGTALCGLGAFLAVRLAGWHRLYDFQHSLATLVGMGVGLALTRVEGTDNLHAAGPRSVTGQFLARVRSHYS